MPMLVCIDIGNTNITLGLIHHDQIVGKYRLTTKARRSSDEFGLMLQSFISRENIEKEDIDDVIITSVVPKVMHSCRNGVFKFFGIEPIIVRPGLKSGISVQMENPRSVGADRIVDCAGAYFHYGGPVLVIDFGTATTYDFVDEKGRFRAGVISVGIETGALALTNQTAQLPEIEIRKPKTIMARNTQSEMEAGVFYQYLGGVEYTIRQFQKQADTNKPIKVVATGGLGRIIHAHTPLIDTYDADLIFKGLNVIYKKNKPIKE